MKKAPRLWFALLVIFITASISIPSLASYCDCTCICDNTCPADGWLPHSTYPTHETYFAHCSTDSHIFFYFFPRKCTYDQEFKHMYWECDWCGISCTHGGWVDHECNHDINCGTQYVYCPDV